MPKLGIGSLQMLKYLKSFFKNVKLHFSNIITGLLLRSHSCPSMPNGSVVDNCLDD